MRTMADQSVGVSIGTAMGEAGQDEVIDGLRRRQKQSRRTQRFLQVAQKVEFRCGHLWVSQCSRFYRRIFIIIVSFLIHLFVHRRIHVHVSSTARTFLQRRGKWCVTLKSTLLVLCQSLSRHFVVLSNKHFLRSRVCIIVCDMKCLAVECDWAASEIEVGHRLKIPIRTTWNARVGHELDF